MLIDVLRPEAWDEVNDSVKTYLGLEPKVRARAYRGLAQAIYEISQGTAHFMAHKRAIGVIKGQTPVFENLLPYYYKETYEVNVRSHTQMNDVKEWVEGLKKETCFVMFAEDHPVTGELYPFADELDRLLNEKRIFSFRISHARHFSESVEIRPYTVRLCSFSANAAVAILGERFRSPAMVVENMAWDKEEFLQELQNARAEKSVNPALVTQFEKEISQSAELYFKPEATRLYDRSVCIFKDVSAEALAESLFKKLGLSSDEGWQKMSSTNMCYWSGTKMFRHWWEPEPSQELLRGLLVIGPDLLNTKDFAKLLISSYEEIKQQQSWSL
ncbi:hypothetical protein [Bdellovibrio svalbardensis]|uniref:Uncharacterized protein n=1 Tax=Bdellovibrio svalbardensis TaxID=2972972 RepID=A0ABT6DFR2_9BACT|nr:hypothetical protein [Bdellovibrio svalbardensis]MDG0815667.1 hypothetical protein [Bdellovibrio svalbardensis]